MFRYSSSAESPPSMGQSINHMPKKKIFAIAHPELLEEWDWDRNSDNGIFPDQIGVSHKGSVAWVGKCGHEFRSWISSRIKGSGCPYCGKGTSAILTGFNDLATTHPSLAAQWDETKNTEKPTEVQAGSAAKAWWIGACGHEWEARIVSRKNGTGCPYCTKTGRKWLLKGHNDLLTSDPELAAQWHPTLNGTLDPTEVTSRSHTRVWWRCSADDTHEWQATVKDRAFGYGCPICVNQKIVSGINDLLTVSPAIAAEWHTAKNKGTRPSQVAPSGKDYVWWQCKSDPSHEWQAAVSDRAAGYGCPFCSGNRVLPGYNDIRTTHPEIAAEWHPTRNGEVQPKNISKGSVTKRWWICPEGHEYLMKPNSRTTGRNCPLCYHPWSKAEKELVGALKESFPGVRILENDKSLFPNNMELDVYIPDLQLAVEFNGDYWHDETLHPDLRKRHSTKRRVCAELGIRLVVVWESDWKNQQDVVLEKIILIARGEDIPPWLSYTRHRENPPT